MRHADADAVCILVMPCAICVSGEVNSRTYRINATITPNSIAPDIASTEPSTATTTYAVLPTTFISGCIMPDRNCERHSAS